MYNVHFKIQRLWVTAAKRESYLFSEISLYLYFRLKQVCYIYYLWLCGPDSTKPPLRTDLPVQPNKPVGVSSCPRWQVHVVQPGPVLQASCKGQKRRHSDGTEESTQRWYRLSLRSPRQGTAGIWWEKLLATSKKKLEGNSGARSLVIIPGPKLVVWTSSRFSCWVDNRCDLSSFCLDRICWWGKIDLAMDKYLQGV